jgi:hypothetical protein
MTVSMALWKAISRPVRTAARSTFDSGRVGAVQAEQLSTLIWGRLDVTPGVGRDAERARVPSAAEGALAVSLPEACRLSDAMTSSLRARLALEPSGLDIGIRVKAIREGIERIRDQIALPRPEPRATRGSARPHRLWSSGSSMSPSAPSAAATSAATSARWRSTSPAGSATSSSPPPGVTRASATPRPRAR